jgi:hypothetical protein
MFDSRIDRLSAMRKKTTAMRPLLVLLWVLVAGSAHAQIVNTQPLLSKITDDGLSAELGTSLEWRTGNVELFRLSASLLVTMRLCDHTLVSSSNLEFGERAGERFLFRTFTHLRYQFRIDDLVTLETFAQVAHDEFRRITLRGLVGAGARWTLWSSEDTTFRLGTAWMFEHERFADGTTPDSGQRRANHRASIYLDLRHDPNEDLAIGATVYYQPRLSDGSDWQLAAESRLAVAVTEALALTLQLVLAYDSTPPDEVVDLDTATLVGVSISL